MDNKLPTSKEDSQAELNKLKQNNTAKNEALEAEQKAGEKYLQDLMATGASPDEIKEARKLLESKKPTVAKNKNVGPKKTTTGKELITTQKSIVKIFTQAEKQEQDKNLKSKLVGLGLTENDFANTSWATLSHGQKMLTLEQVEQNTLSRVKNIGKERFDAKYGVNFSKKISTWKPLTVVNKLWHKAGKSYWISGEEKKAIKDARDGKIKPEKETLKQFIENNAEMDLEIKEKGGKTQIEFIEVNMSLPIEKQKIVEEYNKVADKYARMPDAWRNKSAADSLDGAIFNKKNHEEFATLRDKYNELRKSVIGIRTKEYESPKMTSASAEKRAMTEMNIVDYKITMLQLKNTNPDALKELQKIENEESWKRLFDNEGIWRSMYIGAGYGLRKGLTYSVGILAAPLVGATIGGFRAQRKATMKVNKAFNEGRAEETFLERRAAGKKGLFDDKNANLGPMAKAGKMISGYDVNTKEIAGFVDADSQTQRLNRLMEKLETTTSKADMARIVLELSKRVEYIQIKHDEGLINYGKDKEKLSGTGYALLETLGNAATKVQMNSFDLSKIPDEKITIKDYVEKDQPEKTRVVELRDFIKEQMDKRSRILDTITSNNKKEFGEKISDFKRDEISRGIAVGAGFSVVGWAIRNWWHGGHDLEVAKHVNEKVVGGAAVIPKTTTLPPNTIEKPITIEHGVKNNFEVILGKDGVPKNLETAFNEISADKLDLPASGIVDEQMATKSLNMAANLVELSKGHNILGISATEFGKAVNFDERTAVLKIIDHDKFNEIVNQLKGKADESWTKGILQAKGGAITQIGNIKKEGWLDIMHAKGLVKTPDGIDTGIEGHQGVSLDKIKDFHESSLVKGAIDKSPGGVLKTEHVLDTKTPAGLQNEGGKIIKTGTAPDGNPDALNTNNTQPDEQLQKLRYELKSMSDAEKLAYEKLHDLDNAIDNPHIKDTLDTTTNNNLDDRFKGLPLMTKEEAQEHLTNNTTTTSTEKAFEGGLRPADDMRHMADVGEVRRTFGRSNVIFDKNHENTIDGMPHEEWTKHVDKMFKDKEIKFHKYATYEKERELQGLSGRGILGKKLDIDTDKYVPGAQMTYFRDTDEWPIIEKISAKSFFDFNQAINADGSYLSQADVAKLVKAGWVQNTGTLDNPNYSFVNAKELERLAGLEKEIDPDPLNYSPRDGDTLEKYIARITQNIHQTDDGTLYAFKPGGVINDKMIDDGMIVKQENLLNTRVPRVRNNNIYPGNGVFGQNQRLSVVIGASIRGSLGGWSDRYYPDWTHPLPRY